MTPTLFMSVIFKHLLGRRSIRGSTLWYAGFRWCFLSCITRWLIYVAHSVLQDLVPREGFLYVREWIVVPILKDSHDCRANHWGINLIPISSKLLASVILLRMWSIHEDQAGFLADPGNVDRIFALGQSLEHSSAPQIPAITVLSYLDAFDPVNRPALWHCVLRNEMSVGFVGPQNYPVIPHMRLGLTTSFRYPSSSLVNYSKAILYLHLFSSFQRRCSTELGRR